MNNVRFSIIVPAYNSSSFIKKCIESVLDQTYSEFELILIDDGSQDNTLTICNTYAKCDSRVKVIHKENGGHTSARNEGLKIATGDYILFLDSDDWISGQTLEACYDEIVEYQTDIIVYRMQNSDCSNPYQVTISDGYYQISDLEKQSKNNFIISEDGSFTFPKSLSAKCFKYDIIYNNQLQIPPNVQLGEDGAAFVGALLKAKDISVIVNNEKACYYCFIRSNSISRSADPIAFERATSLLIHYNEILSNASADYSSQFNRNVVAQLYTAALLVLRSGGSNIQLNNGIDDAMKNTVIKYGFRKSKFNLKGYKFILKKFILKYRLWWLARMFDKVGK